MSPLRLRIAIAVLVLPAFDHPLQSAPLFHVVDLGSNTLGVEINAAGQVTGWTRFPGNTRVHAYLYDGSMDDLGTLGGDVSVGIGISASGLLTRYSYLADNIIFHGFLYDGSMHDLGPGLDARAVNDAEQVAGYLDAMLSCMTGRCTISARWVGTTVAPMP